MGTKAYGPVGETRDGFPTSSKAGFLKISAKQEEFRVVEWRPRPRSGPGKSSPGRKHTLRTAAVPVQTTWGMMTDEAVANLERFLGFTA